MSPSTTVTALGATRIAIGAAAFAAPRLTGRAFGLDAAGNPQSPYLARLFGARDAALGLGVLTSEGAAQRHWIMIGAGCDAADALAGVAAGRAGYLPKVATVLVTAAALGGVAFGAAALRDAA